MGTSLGRGGGHFKAAPAGFEQGGGGTALVYAVSPQTVIAFEKGERYGQTTFRFS